MNLAQSVPIINGDDMHVLGWRGQGISVAILDTGVNAVALDLSDDIIAQECWCTGDCCPNGLTGCPVRAPRRTRAVRTWHQRDGIVTANGTVSSIGVAPDAGIVAIRVLPNGATEATAVTSWPVSTGSPISGPT